MVTLFTKLFMMLVDFFTINGTKALQKLKNGEMPSILESMIE